ncbi:MAG: hypothetical protein M5T52_03385 [Ignavibacteriaceae bacterium]|nr:hypothetical protein [Ignavibacteriaceae bacterium]
MLLKKLLTNPEPVIRERAIDAFNTPDANELVRVISPCSMIR